MTPLNCGSLVGVWMYLSCGVALNPGSAGFPTARTSISLDLLSSGLLVQFFVGRVKTSLCCVLYRSEHTAPAMMVNPQTTKITAAVEILVGWRDIYSCSRSCFPPSLTSPELLRSPGRLPRTLVAALQPGFYLSNHFADDLPPAKRAQGIRGKRDLAHAHQLFASAHEVATEESATASHQAN